jgi:hypothetical protein
VAVCREGPDATNKRASERAFMVIEKPVWPDLPERGMAESEPPATMAPPRD